MGSFVQRLASRKFLLAVAAALSAVAAHQWIVAGSIVAVYIAGEAHVDARAAAASASDVAAQLAAAVGEQLDARTPITAPTTIGASGQPIGVTPTLAGPYVGRVDNALPAPVIVHPVPGIEPGPHTVIVTSNRPVTVEQRPTAETVVAEPDTAGDS